MKKIFLLLLFNIAAVATFAQVPYFSSTPGDGNLYGYTSLKARSGINNIETYTCFQYGIGDYLATGIDVYTGKDCAYWGALVRCGKYINPYLGIGAQITPSFNLNDNFKFGYATVALYLNGQITKDGKLFWCSNTWWGINDGVENTISNWEYLGYTIGLPKGHSITPMIGCIHDWKFESETDFALSAYYSVGKWNFYIWGNDFLKDNPRIVLGIDFKLPTE